MKKVVFTAFAALAFAFTMTACNNQPAEAAEDTTAAVAEECEHHCAMDSTCAHECMCGEECKAANCEACPNHGTENCCKAKAAVEGQACEKKCDKAEGKECCKKAEGEHKCAKAEGKECEHKCQK